MATFDSDSDAPRIDVSVQLKPSTNYDSAHELARAFGQAILVPSWWPTDATAISYTLNSTGTNYLVQSQREDGSPVLVVGLPEAAWAGRSPENWQNGEWTHRPDLASSRTHRPGRGSPSLQAVIYDADLAIQLIGYRTEDEIRSSLGSLRTVAPS